MTASTLMTTSGSPKAVFSDCRKYRYLLRRSIPQGLAEARGAVNFVMLNPSTADEQVDDPTIRRCMGFAAAWGFSELIVTNLFAWRATDPKQLGQCIDPVGEGNDGFLLKAARDSDWVVCAWGAKGRFRDRDRRVISLFSDNRVPLRTIRLTKKGHPSHPLYLPKDCWPTLFMLPGR